MPLTLQQEKSKKALSSLPAYIDSSTLSTWRSCRRKYFWSTLNSLYPSGKSVHLIAGGALAAGVEAARRLAFSRRDGYRFTHDDLLQVSYPAFAREWGDYTPPEGTVKSFESTFGALSDYLKEYPPQEDALQPHIRADGRPTVEFTFSIPIEEGPRHPETGNPFLFVGRFDLLGTIQGLNCIADEKTTSALGFSWADQWRLRGQFMGYLWACQQLGYPTDTAVVRGICILKREVKFATAIEQFPQHLIDRWYRMLIRDLNAIVDAYNAVAPDWQYAPKAQVEDANYPYNFADACTSYGGCAFQDLCLAREPESFFGNYIKHRWDPLARQPVKVLEPLT